MFQLSALTLLIMPALAIVAGLKDVTSYTIPNWISAGRWSLAFVAGGADPRRRPADHRRAPGRRPGRPWLPAWRCSPVGWIGGGDAKLFAASALWLGWPAVGIFAPRHRPCAGGAPGRGPAQSALELGARRSCRSGRRGWSACVEQGGAVPYGVAIAVGALVAFPEQHLVNLAHRLSFPVVQIRSALTMGGNVHPRLERAESEIRHVGPMRVARRPTRQSRRGRRRWAPLASWSSSSPSWRPIGLVVLPAEAPCSTRRPSATASRPPTPASRWPRSWSPSATCRSAPS